MIGLQDDGVNSLGNQHVLMFVLFDFAVLQFAAAGPPQSSQTGMSFAVTLPMYTLIPTLYRALLKRAVWELIITFIPLKDQACLTSK